MVRAAIVLTAGLALVGCADLKPTYVAGALVHQSTPFNGPGPAPFGDNGETPETTLDGVEALAGWDRGPLFWEAGVTYALSDDNFTGGPWSTRFRVGYKHKM